MLFFIYVLPRIINVIRLSVRVVCTVYNFDQKIKIVGISLLVKMTRL